jgi:hypothetical protein
MHSDQRHQALKAQLLNSGYRWRNILNRKGVEWLGAEIRLLRPVDHRHKPQRDLCGVAAVDQANSSAPAGVNFT